QITVIPRFLREAMNGSWNMKTAKAFALAAILVSLPSLAFAQSTAPGGAAIAPSPYYGYSTSPYYQYYAYVPPIKGITTATRPPTAGTTTTPTLPPIVGTTTTCLVITTAGSAGKACAEVAEPEYVSGHSAPYVAPGQPIASSAPASSASATDGRAVLVS